MPVACVLVSHLPVKAELARSPNLAGRPVIVVQGVGSRREVLDASPEATDVTAGMSLQQALATCRDAHLVEADVARYHQAHARILGALEERSPVVEDGGLGYAYVDLRGLSEMYGGEPRLVAALLKAAPEVLRPRVGVAQGKFAAYVAAVRARPNGAMQVPDDVRSFLRDVPLNVLPVSWDMKRRLHGFALHTLGQIAAVGPGPLQAQFGTEGKLAWELANGTDGRPVVARQHDEAVTEQVNFAEPVATVGPLLVAAEALVGRAFARPERRGRQARNMVFVGHLNGGGSWQRRVPCKEPVGSRERAMRLVKPVLEAVTLPGALDDLRLTLSGFVGESGRQGSLFRDTRKEENLKEAVRQLAAELGGPPPIYRVREVEPWSRIPERRRALVRYDP